MTSKTFNADLGGLAGADTKCQAVAASAGLTGVFKAWLSDSTTAVKDRLMHNIGAYIRTDGVVVANNWLDLTDGHLKDAIICDEFANCESYIDQENGCAVFTGSSISGKPKQIIMPDTEGYPPFCDNWKSSLNVGLYYGSTGECGNIDGSWTASWGQNCSNYNHLYCVEQ